MLEGAFVSLSVGFVAVGLAVVIGIVLGGIAGYYGPVRIGIGRLRLLTVDALITGLIDVMLSFPTFFLILTVVAILRPSIVNIMIVIGLTSWEGTARFVRAEILSLREREFVQAAQAAGARGTRMIGIHLVPNAVGPVLVSATLGVAGAILTESSLSFLGFGVPPPDATWGNILADGKRYIFDAPWLTLIPGTAILVVVLAFNLFGEGLREAFNPRLREG
jgi:peptide/nickel transport system permease protein